MDDLMVLRTFLGWCSLINVGVLTLAALAIMTMRGFMARLHAAMFGISEEDAVVAYFGYLSNLKTLILIFNLAPYLALVLMTR